MSSRFHSLNPNQIKLPFTATPDSVFICDQTEGAGPCLLSPGLSRRSFPGNDETLLAFRPWYSILGADSSRLPAVPQRPVRLPRVRVAPLPPLQPSAWAAVHGRPYLPWAASPQRAGALVLQDTGPPGTSFCLIRETVARTTKET